MYPARLWARMVGLLLATLLGPGVCMVAVDATELRNSFTYDRVQPLSAAHASGIAKSTRHGREATSTPVRDVGAALASTAPGVAAEAGAAGTRTSTALVRSEWPPNHGFMGKPVETVLKPGTRVDRYGGPGGTFASPEGTPFAARSLRSTSLQEPYNVYEVLSPITVQGGIAAPLCVRLT